MLARRFSTPKKEAGDHLLLVLKGFAVLSDSRHS